MEAMEKNGELPNDSKDNAIFEKAVDCQSSFFFALEKLFAFCDFFTNLSLKLLLFGSSQEFEVKTLKRQGFNSTSTVNSISVPSQSDHPIRAIHPASRRRVTESAGPKAEKKRTAEPIGKS